MTAEFGFPKACRLLDAAEFEAVFAQSQVSSDRYFTVLMRANDKGHARLGLAIAKRKIRKATARNRLKRIIRESFRLNRPQLPAADFVVLAKPAAATAERDVLWESLARHWQRLSAAAAAA
ncbi:ribonuclease P protein component [Methylomarinovum caldicuralii]|uniref:Ribonuclease P protein component n=1 Tax=Methylomarinovum caldicuralii TaxID=438856 RepID=A0AAU9C758_9GAMM|nr:ribonuclease P protein component [Methylomarinovum caldicuralii]BCX83040.1 ribonuclease P protein component [Methylomarinovum caldicuralii]